MHDRTPPPGSPDQVAIACGGTGGHLYPGLAVAERLWELGAAVTLVISRKEVDQQAVRGDDRFQVLALPSVGYSFPGTLRFAWNVWRSFRLALAAFSPTPPRVLLSMGGFTSVAPALAARRLGAAIVLHESNAIPGRANRWLARFAQLGLVWFPDATRRLPLRTVEIVGVPVRSQFQAADAGACRMALGLRSDLPVLLVMGGSQGARGINDALLRALPRLQSRLPPFQVLHLTGPVDERRVRDAYAAAGIPAFVRAYLTEMELALGAADAAVARAGASSAAELAALRVPALLIPFPHAADDHQMANAQALERDGAARLLRQADATPERLADELVALLTDEDLRTRLRANLATWHRPDADRVVAERVLKLASTVGGSAAEATRPSPNGLPSTA